MNKLEALAWEFIGVIRLSLCNIKDQSLTYVKLLNVKYVDGNAVISMTINDVKLRIDILLNSSDAVFYIIDALSIEDSHAFEKKQLITLKRDWVTRGTVMGFVGMDLQTVFKEVFGAHNIKG